MDERHAKSAAPRLDRTSSALAVCAWLASGVYVAWNLIWIGQGHLAPSILSYFTGVPVPTTGFGRACFAALEGDLPESLSWNPFMAPITALCAASALVVVRRVRASQRVVLPNWMALAWAAVLLAAWGVKLFQGPRWW